MHGSLSISELTSISHHFRKKKEEERAHYLTKIFLIVLEVMKIHWYLGSVWYINYLDY